MADNEHEIVTKFKANSNIIVTGQSHAGKSTFVFSLLKHLELFESDIKHILYVFGIWQPLFEQMETVVNSITFHQGIPDKNILERFSNEHGSILLVLDDVMGQGTNNVELMNLFTTYSHHMGITVIFLLQNIFPPGKYMRTISLNAHYIILFKNPRDERQVRTLGSQIFPNQSKYFMDAYKKATELPYSYLCVTLYPGTSERYLARQRDTDCLLTFFQNRKQYYTYQCRIMSSFLKDHLDFLRLLASTHRSQRLQLLHTIDNGQFDILIEVVYNILQGVCSLTKDEEEKLKKHKLLLRKLIERKKAKRVKKQILIRIQALIPTLISAVNRYLLNNGKRGRSSSERKISKITGGSHDHE